MSDLLLAVLGAASWSQQRSVQIPMFACERLPAGIMQKAAGQAGAGRAGGQSLGPWGTGAGHSGVSERRGLAKPFLKRPVQGCFSPCIFAFSPVLLQHFLIAGLPRHSSFWKYCNEPIKATPFKKEIEEIPGYYSGVPAPAGRLHPWEPCLCPHTVCHALAPAPNS